MVLNYQGVDIDFGISLHQLCIVCGFCFVLFVDRHKFSVYYLKQCFLSFFEITLDFVNVLYLQDGNRNESITGYVIVICLKLLKLMHKEMIKASDFTAEF